MGSAVSPNHLTVTIVNNNDCHYDAFPGGTSGDVVYRRTDDPNNQNVYATSGDTAAVSAQGYYTTRGSPDIYACAQTSAGFVQGFDKATNKFTVDASIAAGDATGTDVIASYAGEAGDEFFESFSGTTDTG